MTKANKSYKKVPAVPAWDRIKRLPKMLKNPIPHFMHWRDAHGPLYKVFLGFGSGYVITEPDWIQIVLQKSHKNFNKSKIQTEKLGVFIGQGLLTSNGDYWLQQRRLIQPGFHKKKLIALGDLVNREVDAFVDKMNKLADKKSSMDIAAAMLDVSYNIIIKSLFSDSQSDEEREYFGDIITAVQHFFIRTVRQPYMNPIFKLKNTAEKYHDLIREGDKMIFRIVDERRNSKESKDDLLDMLLDVKYEGSDEGMTDQQIRDEALILFVAGHETTSNALTWLFYLLDRHPEVAEKMREEIKSVLAGRKVSFEDMRSLKYCSNVINETMRLFPPAWMLDRVALEDIEIGDYLIPKGAIVMPFVYGVHNNEKFWEDAGRFDPDRFNPENKKKKHPYAFFPFGGGPRLCIGSQFAMMEMLFLVAAVLPKFDFKLNQTHQPDLEPLVTLRPRGGIQMKVYRRS